MKNIYFIIIILLILVYIIKSTIKSSMPVKESFFWMLGGIVALFLAIFPKSIDKLAAFVGVDYPPTVLLIICILFLLLINYRNSKRIAKQADKIIDLAQQIAILKSKK